MGWRSGEIEGEPAWIHSRYPPFADPDLSAEVLFGALQRFGVSFTDQLAELFVHAEPDRSLESLALGEPRVLWLLTV